MNAITPIVAATDTIWADAYRATSEWRGNTVQRFASAEQAVSETLIVMSELKERADTVRLPHLTGQRFQALSDAIASDGPFATEGAAARDILAAFRRHEDLRPFLCHGLGRIAFDRHSRWLLVLDMLVFQAGKSEKRRRVIDEREAQPLLGDISKCGQKLATALEKLRTKLQS